MKHLNLSKSQDGQPLEEADSSKAKDNAPLSWGGNEKILNLRQDKLSILNGLPHRFYKVI